jgi:hypothetical protein
MKRSDFAQNKKGIKRILRQDSLNNSNMRIYLNDKQASHVQLLRLEASVSNGLVRAHIRQLDVNPETNQVEVTVVNGEMQMSHHDINPKLENGLILERVENDGRYTNFYLRTILDK